MTPHVGEVVQYVEGDNVRAAIVTKVYGGECVNLVVFGDDIDEHVTSRATSVIGPAPEAVRYWQRAGAAPDEAPKGKGRK